MWLLPSCSSTLKHGLLKPIVIMMRLFTVIAKQSSDVKCKRNRAEWIYIYDNCGRFWFSRHIANNQCNCRWSSALQWWTLEWTWSHLLAWMGARWFLICPQLNITWPLLNTIIYKNHQLHQQHLIQSEGEQISGWLQWCCNKKSSHCRSLQVGLCTFTTNNNSFQEGVGGIRQEDPTWSAGIQKIIPFGKIQKLQKKIQE